MSHRWPWSHTTLVAVLIAGLAACPDEDQGPPIVQSVSVTSPIGDRLGVGRSIQLVAEPRDAQGRAVTLPVTWRSSAAGTAEVSAQGMVDGRAAGTATISAEAGGVTGNLMLRVIAADFTAIGATLHDPWAVLVRDALTAPVRQAIANAYAQCEAARQQGNFNALDQCIASARTTINQITGPAHDLVLLAQIALFIDHVERQLQP